MRRLSIALAGLALAVVLPMAALAAPAAATLFQVSDPVPPPLPPKPPPDDEVPQYRPVLEESDRPWGLDDELLVNLFKKAALYDEYTNRFTCDETARFADYNDKGEVSGEEVQRYAYLLERDPSGRSVREFRQRLTPDNKIKPGAIKDEDPFPPAYMWVFLFSRFNEPYFSYRFVADRFDGFDWVLEIEFRGSLPFTDGRDIRQWEGRVLVDAVTYTPLEITAEPSGQHRRIEALYRRYQQSFNIMGFRTAPKPLGYRALIQFRQRRDELTFPTELRYDTFRAVSPKQIVQARASVRTYSGYRIFKTRTEEEVGEKID